jgi:hypothetical protein
MGVTEKMAYRRLYDDQMAVKILVDSEYKTLHFFEGWMDYISGKNTLDREGDYKNYRNGFRMNYPDGSFNSSTNSESGQGYRDKNVIELYKFERDNNVRQSIKYTMVEGFPISMNAMDISYGATDLLELTVNFSFVRYVTEPFTPGNLLSQNFLNQSGQFATPSQNIA